MSKEFCITYMDGRTARFTGEKLDVYHNRVHILEFDEIVAMIMCCDVAHIADIQCIVDDDDDDDEAARCQSCDSGNDEVPRCPFCGSDDLDTFCDLAEKQKRALCNNCQARGPLYDEHDSIYHNAGEIVTMFSETIL